MHIRRDEEIREFATGPGFFKVERDRALALVDDAVDSREIDPERARQRSMRPSRARGDRARRVAGGPLAGRAADPPRREPARGLLGRRGSGRMHDRAARRSRTRYVRCATYGDSTARTSSSAPGRRTRRAARRRRAPAAHMDVQLVEQACVERLLGDARTAADLDVPVTGRFACLPDRLLDAVHERERRRAERAARGRGASRRRPGRRTAGRRSTSRSRSGRPPRARAPLNMRRPMTYGIVRSASRGGDLRPRSTLRLEPVLRTPALEPDDPLVQLLAALAERLFERLIRPGDEAVERHRDVEKYRHIPRTEEAARNHRRIGDARRRPGLCSSGYGYRSTESFERQLGDRVTKRLKSPRSLRSRTL